jgi:hypothetical protein
MKKKVRRLFLKLALLFLKLSKHPLYIAWSSSKCKEPDFPVWGIYTDIDKANKICSMLEGFFNNINTHISIVELNEAIIYETIDWRESSD